MSNTSRGSSPLFVARIISKFLFAKKAMTLMIAAMAWFFAVPTIDMVFVLLFSLYLMLANRIRFQCNAPACKSKAEINLSLLKEDDVFPWFTIYMAIFATAGVLFPISTLILAPESLQTTIAPHLFLLLSQINMEGVTNSVHCHNVIRLLVPIGFNAYRMSSLLTWVTMAHKRSYDGWYAWNLGLAMTNLLLWAYNLFVFLLLRVTPSYFDSEMSPAAPVVWKGQLIPILVKLRKERVK